MQLVSERCWEAGTPGETAQPESSSLPAVESITAAALLWYKLFAPFLTELTIDMIIPI
jgi:hypothetical protein